MKNLQKKLDPNLSGFTLVEMLVVLGIIGMLIGILLPVIYNQLNKAEVTATAADMHTLAKALESCYTDTREYPPAYTKEVARYIYTNEHTLGLELLATNPRQPQFTLNDHHWMPFYDLNNPSQFGLSSGFWNGPYISHFSTGSESSYLYDAWGHPFFYWNWTNPDGTKGAEITSYGPSNPTANKSDDIYIMVGNPCVDENGRPCP